MGASPSRPPPRKYEIAYKAEIRRPNIHSRSLSVRKSFIAFRETVIVHYVRRSTLFVRKSTLVVRRGSELRWTLRIRLISVARVRKSLVLKTLVSAAD